MIHRLVNSRGALKDIENRCKQGTYKETQSRGDRAKTSCTEGHSTGVSIWE